MSLKICNKCNIEKDIINFYKNKNTKSGFRNNCKQCELDYYRNNKEKISKSRSNYYLKNKEKIDFYNKEYTQLNKEKVKNYQKDWYCKNKDSLKYKHSEWHLKNKESVSERKKRTNNTPLGKINKKINKAKRRALEYIAEGSFTSDDILNLFESQNSRCVYCDNLLETSGTNKYHIDHIQPLSKNGTNWVSNLQLLCPHCNLSKGSKTHEEFLEYLTLFSSGS